MRYMLNRLVALALAWSFGLVSYAALEMDLEPDHENTASLAVPTPDDAAVDEPALDPYGDLLIFKNGDRLHGRLVAAEVGKTLTWARADAASAVPFDIDGVMAIAMQKRDLSEAYLTGTRVQLTNEDVLIGEVVEMNDDILILRTWYSGDIQIRRAMIASIHPSGNDHGKLMYEGPNDLEEWTISSGEWKLKRGALHGYGRIGRDMKLPDLCRLRFEVQWPGRYANFSVAFYTSDIRNIYKDSYYMNFGSNTISLQRRHRRDGPLNLGHVEVSHLVTRSKIRVELLVDRKESRFALIINDELVKAWSDPQGFAGDGTGVVFYSSGNRSQIRLSGISVSEWDGKLQEFQKLETGNVAMLQFQNYDRMSGQVLHIRNQVIAFKTPYSTLNIPLERVESLALAGIDAQRARRYADDVSLFFPNGEKVTIRLADLQDNRISGYSENFGDVSLELTDFIGMRFHIYDDYPESDDYFYEDEEDPFLTDNQNLDVQFLQQ